MFAPVVHAATAGGHQQSTAGLLPVGQMTPPLVSYRGSVGWGHVTSATNRAWSECGCHGELAGCWYVVTEVAGLGRRRCNVIQATALEEGAFEFAAEFPCWKNDKLEQHDVTYILQAIESRVCRYKYMTKTCGVVKPVWIQLQSSNGLTHSSTKRTAYVNNKGLSIMPTYGSHVIIGVKNGCSRMTFVIQLQCVFCDVIANLLITVHTTFRHNVVMRKIRTDDAAIVCWWYRLSSSDKTRSKLNDGGSTQECYRCKAKFQHPKILWFVLHSIGQAWSSQRSVTAVEGFWMRVKSPLRILFEFREWNFYLFTYYLFIIYYLFMYLLFIYLLLLLFIYLLFVYYLFIFITCLLFVYYL